MSSSSSSILHLLSFLPLLRRRDRKNKQRGDEDPGQVWEDILLFHILPKLPIKSLFRFKCVCKNWLQWISHDPAFIREQSRHSLASPGIVYMSPNCRFEFLSTGGNPIDLPDISLKFLKGTTFMVLSSCNGLICVSLRLPNYTRRVIVGNPVTEEWSLIPLSDIYREFFALAFDPLESLLTYKLVRPCSSTRYYNNDGKEFGFEVFSSDTGVWTVSGAKVVIKNHRLSMRSLFKGGILYWATERLYMNCDHRIIWFDLKKDLAGVLLPPGTDLLEDEDDVLGVWEGKPCCSRIIPGKLEAWTLIEFKWIRIYTMSLDSVIEGISNRFNLSRRRCEELQFCYQLGKFLYFAVATGRGYEIICYDRNKGLVVGSRACKYGLARWPFFEYNNNFVRVPKLCKHVS